MTSRRPYLAPTIAQALRTKRGITASRSRSLPTASTASSKTATASVDRGSCRSDEECTSAMVCRVAGQSRARHPGGARNTRSGDEWRHRDDGAVCEHPDAVGESLVVLAFTDDERARGVGEFDEHRGGIAGHDLETARDPSKAA